MIDDFFGFSGLWTFTERGRKQRHRIMWVATKPPARERALLLMMIVLLVEIHTHICRENTLRGKYYSRVALIVARLEAQQQHDAIRSGTTVFGPP